MTENRMPDLYFLLFYGIILWELRSAFSDSLLLCFLVWEGERRQSMELLYWLSGFRTEAGNAFFMAVTYLGDEVAALALMLAVFWCIDKKMGYYMIYGTVFGLLCNQLLKSLFAIPRPWIRDPGFQAVAEAKATAGGYSFPSGHTATATAVYGSMARYSREKVFRGICLGLIALVGFSRMYLGVHTPADVGVSLLVGTILIFVLYPVVMRSGEAGVFWRLQAVFLVCVLGLFVFLTAKGIPEDPSLTEEELIHGAVSAMKAAWQILGMGLGILVSHYYDHFHRSFPTKAVWWAQILKVVLGLLLVVAVKEGLKLPLSALFGGHPAATAVRYFLVVAAAGLLWPLTFGFFGRLGKKEEGQRAEI
jgi:undecaprenyl-diphosphatase